MPSKDTASAIEIVDLSAISHLLVKRGREPYRNDALESALLTLAVGQPLVWNEATVSPTLNDQQATAYKAKMRNRICTCAKVVNVIITVTWATNGTLVAIRKG